jgi:hypothetical protein
MTRLYSMCYVVRLINKQYKLLFYWKTQLCDKRDNITDIITDVISPILEFNKWVI